MNHIKPFKNSNRKTLVITGGNGFIGTHLRKKLSDKYNLLNIDMRPTKLSFDNEQSFNFNLKNTNATINFSKILRPYYQSISGIIHLADYYDFTNKPTTKYNHARNGFENFLDINITQGIPSVPIIAANSISILEPSVPNSTENNLLSPYTNQCLPYIENKILLEQTLLNYKKKFPVCSLLLGGVYSDKCELYLLYQFLERIRLKQFDMLFTCVPNNYGLSYVHINEVVDTITQVLTKEFNNENRFLVGQKKR